MRHKIIEIADRMVCVESAVITVKSSEDKTLHKHFVEIIEKNLTEMKGIADHLMKLTGGHV